MRNAESVTFGSSALNRAAEQRNKEAQALLVTQDNALVTIFWRGKPLFRKENNSNLAPVSYTHLTLPTIYSV